VYYRDIAALFALRLRHAASDGYVEVAGIRREDPSPAATPAFGRLRPCTRVADAGVKEPAPLKNLTTLKLLGTKVTDAGVKELASLKNLTTLSLAYAHVTDAGLKELTSLKNLTRLNLGFTQVTDAGVKELQPALPKCKIEK
jgi:Leucine-rich repeat (LRR) protein